MKKHITKILTILLISSTLLTSTAFASGDKSSPLPSKGTKSSSSQGEAEKPAATPKKSSKAIYGSYPGSLKRVAASDEK